MLVEVTAHTGVDKVVRHPESIFNGEAKVKWDASGVPHTVPRRRMRSNGKTFVFTEEKIARAKAD
jgi:hypothetical protein